MAKLTRDHLALARSYLRHLSRLPDPITRDYFLNILHKRCRRPHGSDPDRVQKRVAKTVCFIENVRLKIAAANSGHVNVLEELLKEAYARTGERRDEFIKPYLAMSSAADRQRPYPSSEFPIYSPALVALVTSSESHSARSRPSVDNLQSIPPGSLITNVWSDLPPRAQPVVPSKAAHMGMLHPARQVNKRRALHDRWLAGLIGPPLAVPVELEDKIPTNILSQSRAMLAELNSQASAVGPSGLPRHAPRTPSSPSQPQPGPVRRTSAAPRIPAHVPASHPLSPSPPPIDADPLTPILPKRQQPTPAPPPLHRSRGPRTLRPRLIRRRYQDLLGLVPVLTNAGEQRSNAKRENAKVMDEDGTLVDRSWITCDSEDEKHVRFGVRKAGTGLGAIRVRDMDGEDLDWMP